VAAIGVSGATGATGATGVGGATPANSGESRKRVSIDYTSPVGWHYSGDLTYPNISVDFSRNINTSPPGKAKLQATVRGKIPDWTLSADNPGRHGPQLHVPLALAYPLRSTTLSLPASTAVYPGTTSCVELGLDPAGVDPYLQGDPYHYEMHCAAGTGFGQGNSATSDTMREADVNDLVAQLSSEDPTYVLNFKTNSSCSAYVSPAGTVRKSSKFARGCGALKIGVTN